FTEGLYAEMRGTGVAVTVVFPGGVSTDITTNSGIAMPAGAEAAASEENSFTTTTPQEAAEQIIAGVDQGSYRVVIGKDARMMDKFSRLAPQRATDTIAKKMAALLG
ncbi:MAG: hypothetical protein U0R78_05630, partial [Nocardioidaceae bacterium]